MPTPRKLKASKPLVPERASNASIQRYALRSTQAPHMSISQRHVFQVTELLERVLLQLPWQDVFVCQGVCQRFKDIISNSVMLQQKMFLRYADATKAAPTVTYDEKPKFLDEKEEEDEEFIYDFLIDHEPKNVEVCPVLERRKDIGTARGVENHRPRVGELIYWFQAPFAADVTSAAASWKDMHLADQPITEVCATFQWQVGSEESGTWGKCRYESKQPLRDPRGFTIARVIDAAFHDEKGSCFGSSHDMKHGFGGTSPGRTLENLERRLGVKAHSKRCWIRFMDIGAGPLAETQRRH